MLKRAKLVYKRVLIDHLRGGWIEEMWSLYADHYDNMTRDAFDRDLAAKQFVFLGFDEGGAVRAFSTGSITSYRYRGGRVGIYFSGDTMVHPDYWGQRGLHRAVVLNLLRWRARHPLRRLYWHLTCNGYRTFLTLVNNLPEHWPHPQRGLPRWERGLIDLISRERFGERWCPERGVVRDDVVLRSEVAPLTPEVRAIPAVRFFMQVNPGFAEGEELSMIGRVDLGLVWRLGLKLARQRLRRRRAARLQLRPATEVSPDAATMASATRG